MTVTSRKDAKTSGLTRYFTGEPCKNGHLTERLVCNKACVSCLNNYTRAWKVRNPLKVKEYETRRRSKLPRRLGVRLRSGLWKAIRRGQKTGSAIRDLGCSIPEFIIYMETKFSTGMNWENWGIVWEIDHKSAFCKHDMTDPLEVKKVCHYTNLQPLFIEDHKTKTNQDRRVL